MLEKAVVLMETYASAEVGACLIPKAWKGQIDHKHQGQADQSPCQGGEQQGRLKQGPRHGSEGWRKPRRESRRHEQREREQGYDRQVKGLETKEGFLPPMPQMKHKLMGTKCFTCGHTGHFQRECPHVVCVWTRALKEPQVKG